MFVKGPLRGGNAECTAWPHQDHQGLRWSGSNRHSVWASQEQVDPTPNVTGLLSNFLQKKLRNYNSNQSCRGKWYGFWELILKKVDMLLTPTQGSKVGQKRGPLCFRQLLHVLWVGNYCPPVLLINGIYRLIGSINRLVRLSNQLMQLINRTIQLLKI